MPAHGEAAETAPQESAAESTPATETQTQAPAQTENITPEPTSAPTAEPTPEATGEATAEPVPEASLAPAPEDTSTPTPEPTAALTATPEPEDTPTPEPTAEPTPEITETPTPEPTATPEPLSLHVSASNYAYAGSTPISIHATISGGVPEYCYSCQIYLETVSAGTLAAEFSGADAAWSYMPTSGGRHIAVICAEDGAGQTASAQVEIQVAQEDAANRSDWLGRAAAVQKSGDWRSDLIAVAETQLGYRESTKDFILDSRGKKQGYTIYGDLYGLDYSEWCAMFVSACLRYAGVSQEDFPISASCERWKTALEKLGAYEDLNDGDGDYTPSAGDLVFFRVDGKAADEAHHIGIVTAATDRGIETIEGNTSSSVARKSYEWSDSHILGYANTKKLMARAGALPAEELTVEITIGSGEVMTASQAAEISFRELVFCMNCVSQQVWNPETHSYEDRVQELWSAAADSNVMYVCNTAGVDMLVTAYVEQDEACGGAVVTVDGQAASEKKLSADESVSFEISIEGEVADLSPEESRTIGRICLRLTPVQS